MYAWSTRSSRMSTCMTPRASAVSVPGRRNDPGPAPRDLAKGCVPRDPLEPCLALGPDATQGMKHAEGGMDALGIGAHLAADDTLGERMRGVAGDAGQPSLLDRDQQS